MSQKPIRAKAATPAGVLRAAARYLTAYGWIQGSLYTPSDSDTPACSILGALAMVCWGHPIDEPLTRWNEPQWRPFMAAVDLLYDRLPGADLSGFNDAQGRTAQQVITMLHEAADEWDRAFFTSTDDDRVQRDVADMYRRIEGGAQ